MPSNWTTGYWLQGTSEPGTMDDVEIYGTEVFEVSLAEMSAGE
jgi:purine nucleoside permease